MQNLMYNKDMKILKSKKLLKKVIVSVASTLAISGIVLSGLTIYANKKVENYASQTQINEIAREINVNTDKMMLGAFGNSKRMAHNNGRPILVTISNDFTTEEKEDILFSLNHIFGLVKEINKNYNYEIIKESELSEKYHSGDTVINYKLGEVNFHEYASATYRSSDDFLTSAFTNKPLVESHTITFNRKKTLSSKYGNIISFNHELLHVFQLGDVYSSMKDKKYFNTATNSMYTLPLITPNDYGCLISTYAPKFDNLEDKQNFINKFKQKLNNYDKEYYKLVKEEYKLSGEKFDELTFNAQEMRTVNGISMTYNYSVSIEDDKYNFDIFNENNELLDTSSGKIIKIDNVYFLKDVELKSGQSKFPDYAEGGSISTFALFKEDNSLKLQSLSTGAQLKSNIKTAALEK